MTGRTRQVLGIAVLGSALLLAGCQDDDQPAEPSPTAGGDATTAAPTTDAVASSSAEPDPTAAEALAEDDVQPPCFFPEEPAEWHVPLVIVDGPATFTATDGVTFEVLQAWLSTLADAPGDVIENCPVDLPSTAFTLYVRTTNEGDEGIGWSRPALEVDGTRFDGPTPWIGWMSDEWPARTINGAMPVYAVPEDVASDDMTSGEGRLEGGRAYSTATGETYGTALDLPFAWQPE